MTSVWVEEGVGKGRELERRQVVTELLEQRFGELPDAARQRLLALSHEQLVELSKRILRAASLQELGLE